MTSYGYLTSNPKTVSNYEIQFEGKLKQHQQSQNDSKEEWEIAAKLIRDRPYL